MVLVSGENKMGKGTVRGFSLIELMIVVAVIAIIAAIAYPSYMDYVRQSRRADATVALLELAQYMERYYTNNGRYTDGDGNYPALPFDEAPRDGSDKYYDLSLNDTPSATSYTLSAAPKNAQENDDCGTLTLDHLGVKGAEDDVDHCWKQ
jgi:type IV pilus assembly protein PilE